MNRLTIKRVFASSLIFFFCLQTVGFTYLALLNSLSIYRVGLNEEIPFIPFIFNESSYQTWVKITSRADQNQNGISDKYDQKLDSLLGVKSLGSNKGLEKTSSDNLSIIVSFPSGEIDEILSLFKNLGGNLKDIYSIAINGFAGSITKEGLDNFCNILNRNNIPFLVEEDGICKGELYFASRNMNLRPYVWNTLGYTGDSYSSIAILDSGIDPSHSFFTPGYSNGNSSYKIIGWNDILNVSATPYDDYGHGSACAGIAAGVGGPTLDGKGQVVATYGYEFDRTGNLIGDHVENRTLARFNVTHEGNIEIDCEFYDLTTGFGDVHVYAYLYQKETIIDSYIVSSDIWSHTLSYNATNSTLGDYSLRISIDYDSGGLWVGSPIIKFRAEIHWPFNPPLFGSGDPWKGIASDTHLVGVKVIKSTGEADDSDVLSGLNWIIANKLLYNITIISMSIGGVPGKTFIINAVNTAVDNGIVTVVSAGNDGGIGNNVGSPGDADNVITVAAMSNDDHVTDYSSAGGLSYSGGTTKPDIMAPGGSYYNFTIFSAETNENDAHGKFANDSFANDLYSSVGTSFSTPAVAGAANLLIEAMGGHQNWNYNAIDAKRVKALLLMTATETYPLLREVDYSYSPSLDRGAKDVHEGYGRINIDTALEAVKQKLNLGETISAWLSSSEQDPFQKHALGCYVDLISGQNCPFHLTVPTGSDFDLYIYSNDPSSIGEPILVASSTSAVLYKDEPINFTAPATGRYYLIAKAISGEGYANISYKNNILPPELTQSKVIPSQGNQSTLFNFSVKYSDPDNFAPIFIDVLINGTDFGMEKQNPSDLNYIDGCIYEYSTYLQPEFYNYSFKCSDGLFFNTTALYTNLTVTEFNTNSPILSDWQHTPSFGYNGSTNFIFSVNYTDPDNNAPRSINVIINSTSYSMIQQNELDSNYMDGSIFIFSTILDIGTYEYYFNCSDSDHNASIGPFVGPTVEFTLQWNETRLDGVEIGMITSHGEVNPQFEYMNVIFDIWERGATTTKITSPINLSLLLNYDIIWIDELGVYNITVQEINTIEEWLRLGGRLIVTGDKLRDAGNITERFNITLSDPLGAGPSDEISIHYITLGVNEIYFPLPLRSLNVSAQPNANICASLNGAPMIVSMKFGFGKMVILLDDGVLSGITLSDNRRLVNNTFGWLSYKENDNNPILSNENLFPSTGNQSTQLNFTVLYTDIDNNPPDYINVVINGTPYPMNKKIPLKLNYSDGCYYELLTYLQAGNYTYYFECSDGVYYNTTNAYPGLYINEINLNPPTLSNGRETPVQGYNMSTLFVFRVNYTDSDNNMPEIMNLTINSSTFSMYKQDLTDLYYIDGCIYEYSTILDEGTYYFYYNCSDGNFSADNGPHNGPIVVSSVRWNQVSLEGVKIGCVITHGEDDVRLIYSNMTKDLLQRGANVTDINVTLNLDLLANYDIILLGRRGTYMANEEVDAIERWVKMGGIFLSIDSLDGSNLKLGKKFNMSLVQDRGKGLTNEIYPHPITSEVEEIYFDEPWRSLNISGQPNADLCVELEGYPMVVVMEYGEGKLGIVMEYIFNYFENADNHLLINNTFGWLGYTENYFAPTLTLPTISPSGGNQSTKFNFTVIYTDLDNQPPRSLKLIINGTSFLMEKQNISDHNYEDGCLYQFQTYLQPGLYEYYYDCVNGIFSNSTQIVTGLNISRVNLNPPTLNNAQVSPNYGENYTVFEFMVNYSDLDNNEPIFVNITINSQTYQMVPQNPLDDNYMDGAIFLFSSSFETGSYFFHINTSDGDFTTELANRFGPIVEPINKWNETRLDGIQIGAIVNHGDRNPITTYFRVISDLVQRGASLAEITSEINSSLLTNFDIIWCDEYKGTEYAAFSVAEIDAIEQWVFNGGSLIITGDSPYSTLDLIRGFNISYLGVIQTGGLSMDILHHPITTYVNSIDYYLISLISLDPSLQPNAQVCARKNGYDKFVAMEHGDGKLVVYADDTTKYPERGDNHQLINNTFGWLSVKNFYAPNLSAAYVSPLNANQSTKFNFTIEYSDPDNNSPLYINVLINGTPYSMTKVNPVYENYTNGCTYQFNTYLQPGNYNYSFECHDRKHYYSSITYFGPTVVETNNFTPYLINPQVSPEIGWSTTRFTFSVWYFDADNNFPRSINITINNTTYSMNLIDPLDGNVMDGTLYYFSKLLGFGFHRFQINCSDGFFYNNTSWISAPNLDPFYGVGQVLINELCAYADYIEMFNYGSDRDMTGWTLQIYDGDVLYITYNFPAGWIFKGHYTVVLRESTGTDTDTDIYLGLNIPWTDDSIAVGLFDNTGEHVDWVQTSNFVGSRPSDIEWEQDHTLLVFNNYLYRKTDKDTNKASDWITTDSGTPGALNPEQTGFGYISVEYLTPTLGNSYSAGSITFSWNSLELSFEVYYILQISKTADFSTIIFESIKIPETGTVISITLVINLLPDKYYWRIIPMYENFSGNISNYSTLTMIPSGNWIVDNFWIFLLIGGVCIAAIIIRKTKTRKKSNKKIED